MPSHTQRSKVPESCSAANWVPRAAHLRRVAGRAVDAVGSDSMASPRSTGIGSAEGASIRRASDSCSVTGDGWPAMPETRTLELSDVTLLAVADVRTRQCGHEVTMSQADRDPVVPVCRRPAQPGDLVGGLCPACGHLNAVHIGTIECPVCRLVELASPAGQRREARIRGIVIP